MMNKTWAMGGAALAVVVAGGLAVAFANDWGASGKGGHGRGHGGRGGGGVYLLHYDANKDGSVTRAEIDAGIGAEFQAADGNADGKLDAAEFQKYNDARRAERKARIDAWRAKHGGEGRGDRAPSDRGSRNFDPMRSMDWNLDGFITPDEFGGKTRAQAMRADRNGDGTIAADEIKKRGRKGDKDKTTPAEQKLQ